MAITRLPATALSGTSLPSTITSASGLPLGKLINSSNVRNLKKNNIYS